MKFCQLSGSTKRLLARVEAGLPPRGRRIRKSPPALTMLHAIRNRRGGAQ
jgi:hypothetical protein